MTDGNMGVGKSNVINQPRSNNMTKYMVFNVGCIECGVSCRAPGCSASSIAARWGLRTVQLR